MSQPRALLKASRKPNLPWSHFFPSVFSQDSTREPRFSKGIPQSCCQSSILQVNLPFPAPNIQVIKDFQTERASDSPQGERAGTNEPPIGPTMKASPRTSHTMHTCTLAFRSPCLIAFLPRPRSNTRSSQLASGCGSPEQGILLPLGGCDVFRSHSKHG